MVIFKKDIPFTFILITSFLVSFDVFLVFNLGGFSIRIAQLLLILPMAYTILLILKRSAFKPFLGWLSLCIWFFFMVLFIPNTNFIERNINYVIWLLFNILLILSFVELINTREKAIKIVKVYLYSFLVIGGFGVLQFIFPFLGITPIFISQRWPNGLVRVSGFSYEPSYFATYMVMGWSLIMYLKIKKTKLLSNKMINFILIIITLSILLSSSRMGIGLIGLWVVGYLLIFFSYLFKGILHIGYLKVIALFVIGIVLVLFFLFTSDKYSYLLEGTGINGTSDHSLDARSKRLVDTLNAFKESPIIGYSLGGIPSAIGSQYNIEVINQEIATQFEGMSIFAEVLAASGIIGFIPFAIYIVILIFSPLRLAKRIHDKEVKNILVGLVVSLLAILVILQFNQNIFRLYLWYHIGILSAFYSVVSKARKGTIIEE